MTHMCEEFQHPYILIKLTYKTPQGLGIDFSLGPWCGRVLLCGSVQYLEYHDPLLQVEGIRHAKSPNKRAQTTGWGFGAFMLLSK